MSVRAVKEKAAKLVASGQFERAEVLLRQALTQSPRDVATWLRHAEVLKRLSRNPDAVASYRLAARILDEEGHHPRAVAALKLALSLVPDDVDLIADIIRSEMRARREGKDARALFPLSSPSQLLTAASSESGLFQGANSMAESSPQLALPMSTPVRPAHVDAPASLRAQNAAARADAWVPEPTAPEGPTAGGFAAPPAPLPPPDAAVAEAASSPAPSAAPPPAPLPPPDAAVAEAASSPVPSDALPTAPGLPLDGPSQLTSHGTSSPAPVPAALPSGGAMSLDGSSQLAFDATSLLDTLPRPAPSAPLRFEVEASAQWPQVRRLSDLRIAVQAAEGARWVVLEASSPIAVRFADELEIPDDAEWLE
ncbi:MAG: tetratricopeptide repeat protein [Archangiaceae bacterium]|nr:tetratricopeptide repeat protein [Archangiaceae bacterium]